APAFTGVGAGWWTPLASTRRRGPRRAMDAGGDQVALGNCDIVQMLARAVGSFQWCVRPILTFCGRFPSAYAFLWQSCTLLWFGLLELCRTKICCLWPGPPCC